jgi:hypothetical protein
MADSGSSSKTPSSNTSSNTFAGDVSVSAITSILPNIPQVVSIKLDGPNYLAWVSQFLPTLKCYELVGIVDGSEPCPPQFMINSTTSEESPNPAYAIWQKKDQHILSWILCSLNPTIMSSMYGLNTSKLAWDYLANRSASQSRSRISHLKRQLQSLQQGSKSCT